MTELFQAALAAENIIYTLLLVLVLLYWLSVIAGGLDMNAFDALLKEIHPVVKATPSKGEITSKNIDFTNRVIENNVLQIVEASVNAHLLQFNTDDNLSLRPTFVQDPILYNARKVGFSLKYTL